MRRRRAPTPSCQHLPSSRRLPTASPSRSTQGSDPKARGPKWPGVETRPRPRYATAMPNRLPPAAGPDVQRIAALIALGSTCLIVYGSLFPFDFSHDAGSLMQVALGLHFRRTTRGDIVANLLLYLPFGLGLVPLLRARYGRVVGLTVGVATGLWLS